MLNSVNRWNPTTAYLASREPLFRMFDSIFQGDMQNGEEMTHRSWVPPVDIQETEEAYVFLAELPGLRGDAGMAAHADADHRYLGDIGGAIQPLIADGGSRLFNSDARPLVVG